MKINKLPVPQNDHNPEDIDFMMPVSAALRRKPHSAAKVMTIAIGLLALISIIWANVATLDELSIGEGKVVPSGQVKKIGHLEGGIITDIKVNEGDIVKAGQVLLTVDNTVAASKYNEGLELYYGAKASIERLNAQIADKPFVPSQELKEKAPAIVEREMARYNAAIAKVKNDQEIAVNEANQRRQELAELESKAISLAEKLKLNQEENRMMEPLAKSGAVSKVELLRSQKQVIDNQSDLNSTNEFILKAKAAIKESEDKIENVAVTARNTDSQELKEHVRMLSNTKHEIVSGKDLVKRSNILSPVHGVVKLINVGTIGGVIQAGQVLMEIVPIEDTLEIEAKILPKDIAFLRPGLPATVKMSAYDYSIYGGLDATVTEISADALKDTKENEYFRVTLKTKKNHLVGIGGKKIEISPGMSATVDIATGKRTVMQYLMMPITRAQGVALTER